MNSSENSRTVPATIDAAADSHPDKVAVRVGGAARTFGQLNETARRVAGAIAGVGVGRGDPLVLMLENRIEAIELWLGAAAGGAVEAPINPELKGDLLRHAIVETGTEVIAIDAARWPSLAAILPVGKLRLAICVGESAGVSSSLEGVDCVAYQELLASADGRDSRVSPAESDPAAIFTTSGTTGPSKGVLIAHRHASDYASRVGRLLEVQSADVLYAPLPLHHLAGQMAMTFCAWQNRAAAVVAPRFSVSNFWADCERERVTVTFLLGAMAHLLHSAPAAENDASNTLDRVLMVPLVGEVDGFRERFGVRVTTCYGSTEFNVPLAADFTVTEPGVVGRVSDGFEVRVVDEDDEEVPLGQVGELVVRAREPWTTMVEYYNQPEATARAQRNHWLHTGDAFRTDATGQFYFVDRIKDAIRRRGENVSSFEVEREVNGFPGIVESAAIALPSTLTEDDLGVVAVARPDVSIESSELTQYLRDRLPRHMVPDAVFIARELPKTATGKVRKDELRSCYALKHQEVHP